MSQYSSLLAPLAVDAVLNVRDLDRPDSVDLRDIKVLRKLGGTVSSIRKYGNVNHLVNTKVCSWLVFKTLFLSRCTCGTYFLVVDFLTLRC